MMTETAIAMGGNIGNVPATMGSAMKELALAGMKNIAISSCYRTAPVACMPGTPDFINAAMSGYWSASPMELLALCQRIERQHGRHGEHPVNAARTLDLDIILFGDQEVRSSLLTIPHPRAAERLFVLIPLAEIAPQMVFPGVNQTVFALLKRFPAADYALIKQTAFKIEESNKIFKESR